MGCQVRSEGRAFQAEGIVSAIVSACTDMNNLVLFLKKDSQSGWSTVAEVEWMGEKLKKPYH